VSHVDAFEHDDAAYVLGLLSDTERVAFESHMRSCDACTERVRTLAATTDLLAKVSEEDLLALGDADSLAFSGTVEAPMPDTLLPGLLRRAGVARRRQRWISTGVVGLAAASLIALVIVVWPSAGSAAAPAQAMSVLRATPLRATAAVSDTDWGTRVILDCDYYGDVPAGVTRGQYGLTVVGKDGSRHSLGTWTVAAGAHTKFTSGTALPSAAIRSIEITRGDGIPLLALNLRT
jgi:hypothetical protein